MRVAEIAFEYRQKFQRDVVIDIICYRRRGHNEGDDPSMTQPQMYSLINDKPSTRKLYMEALIERGDLTEDETEGLVRNFQEHLDEAFAATRAGASEVRSWLERAGPGAAGLPADAELRARRRRDRGRHRRARAHRRGRSARCRTPSRSTPSS